MSLVNMRAKNKILAGKTALTASIDALMNNEKYAGEVEKGVVDMNWLKKSFNDSWYHLKKSFQHSWESTVKFTKNYVFFKKRHTSKHKRTEDFAIEKTNKAIYDKMIAVRSDIKNDYYKLARTLGDVMDIAKSGEKCAILVTNKLNLR